jgi:hypothetical protein
MAEAPAPTSLSPQHLRTLERAVDLLENTDFASRLSDYAGRPIQQALGLLPKAAGERLNKTVEVAVRNCLNIAINSLGAPSGRRPASAASAVWAGVGGGVSGFIGFAALPVELPVTTTLMLRSIAEIARHHGEDLTRLEARLACMEVLSLGAGRRKAGPDVGYFATRAMLARLVGDASAMMAERGAAGLSSTAASGFVAEIAQRFGVVVSERASASALPVIGALGGASINYLFMRHFQRLAHGHFAIRRLERRYGPELVQSSYQDLAARRPASPRAPERARLGRAR